jgi:hypothetical protein
MEFDLVPPRTRVTENADGEPFDVRSSGTRTFLLTLSIFDQLEQESLDVSIFGSADGQAWNPMPLLKIPQSFYRGHVRQVLDLTLRPEIQFIRSRWELTRWGRVAPAPMFVIGVHAEEIPAFPRAASPVHSPASA